MAKREIPLFIYDKTRAHRLGECDFIVCTDRDNGFVAKIDFIEGEKEEAGTDYRIGSPNGGCSMRLTIARRLGANPTEQATRTLLRSAMKYVTENGQVKVNIDKPTVQDCISFLDLLENANLGRINECSLAERRTLMTSVQMLRNCIDYLKRIEHE